MMIEILKGIANDIVEKSNGTKDDYNKIINNLKKEYDPDESSIINNKNNKRI